MAKDILVCSPHMVLFIIRLTTTRHAKKSSVWLIGPNTSSTNKALLRQDPMPFCLVLGMDVKVRPGWKKVLLHQVFSGIRGQRVFHPCRLEKIKWFLYHVFPLLRNNSRVPLKQDEIPKTYHTSPCSGGSCPSGSRQCPLYDRRSSKHEACGA